MIGFTPENIKDQFLQPLVGEMNLRQYATKESCE